MTNAATWMTPVRNVRLHSRFVMNRRHFRVGRGVAVAVALAAAIPVALPTSASADPISDQKELVSQVTDQLEALETQSDILAENLVTALDEKTQLDAQVAAAEQKVAEQQAAVDALRGSSRRSPCRRTWAPARARRARCSTARRTSPTASPATSWPGSR